MYALQFLIKKNVCFATTTGCKYVVVTDLFSMSASLINQIIRIKLKHVHCINNQSNTKKNYSNIQTNRLKHTQLKQCKIIFRHSKQNLSKQLGRGVEDGVGKSFQERRRVVW